MSTQDFQNNAMRAVATGAVAYGVSRFVLGYGGDITLYGMNVDSNLAFGIGAAGGSLVGSTVIQNVTSMLDDDKKKQFSENRFLQPVAVGASTYLLGTAFMGGGSPVPIIALGAGSELIASYIQDSLQAMPDASTTSTTPSSNDNPSAYV